ncbi:MAG: SpoIIE family protein phosphatase [Clostridia bacterium]|nr:SpoIIE family protein phosphatase [Clostridia bacterium]
MTLKTCKNVLNAMPEGVFTFDNKLCVKFMNTAFRRAFSVGKDGKKLPQILACGETTACGTGEKCAYCAFHRAMVRAVETGTEQTETMHTSVKRADRTDQLSVRIRVFPVDNKGKLFVGLTDVSFQSAMEREMLSARQIQQRLLPAGKSAGGIAYAYIYLPHFDVGGDMPDVYELNGDVYGVICDVSGKGVSAGLLSAFVKAGFDKKQPDLGKAICALNTKFQELNQDERAYITLASVRIQPKTKTLKYALAGHNAPILLKTADGIHEIEQPAPPVSTWQPDFAYQEKQMPYETGNILALLTDGVTECVNSKGEMFGIERVESVLMQSHSADDFVAKLKAGLSVFAGGTFSDDVTALAFDL